MKKIMTLILMLCMMVCLAACGGGADDNDPNLGTYTAQKASYSGIEMAVEDFFEGGFTIELKSGGKCKMTIDGTSASGKWTLDGTDFTVEGGGVEEQGTLEAGVIVLEDVMDSGVTITLVNEAYAPETAAETTEAGTEAATEAPAETETPATAETQAAETAAPETTAAAAAADGEVFRISGYVANGQEYGTEMVKAAGMEETYLALNRDGSGTMCISGASYDITWKEDGTILLAGTPTYRYEKVDADHIRFVLAESVIYLMERGAGETASAAETTAAPAENQSDHHEDDHHEDGSHHSDGEPCSTGDGMLADYDALLKVCKYISDVACEEKLTYEEVVAYIGVEGLDDGNKGPNSMTQLGDHYFNWYADKTHYIHVCFRGRDASGRFECCQWNTSNVDREEWENLVLE